MLTAQHRFLLDKYAQPTGCRRYKANKFPRLYNLTKFVPRTVILGLRRMFEEDFCLYFLAKIFRVTHALIVHYCNYPVIGRQIFSQIIQEGGFFCAPFSLPPKKMVHKNILYFLKIGWIATSLRSSQ